MYEALLAIFLIVAILLVVLIMLQQGNGYNIGIPVSGISNAFFNSSSLSKFLIRATGILAALFFAISLILCNLNKNKIGIQKNRWMNLDSQTKTELTKSDVLINKNNDIPN